MASSPTWKREVGAEHYCRLGTPTANEKLDPNFYKEINAWPEASEDASKTKNKKVVQKGYRKPSQGKK